MKLLSAKEIMHYEIGASWWVKHIGKSLFMRKLASKYFAYIVGRKYARYMESEFKRSVVKGLSVSLMVLLLSSCALHPSRQATFYRMDNIGLVVHIDTKHDIVWVRFDCSEANTRKRCYDIVGYDLRKLGYTEVGQQLKLM